MRIGNSNNKYSACNVNNPPSGNGVNGTACASGPASRKSNHCSYPVAPGRGHGRSIEQDNTHASLSDCKTNLRTIDIWLRNNGRTFESFFNKHNINSKNSVTTSAYQEYTRCQTNPMAENHFRDALLSHRSLK